MLAARSAGWPVLKTMMPLVTLSSWLLFAVIVLAVAIVLAAAYDRGRRL